MSENVVMTRFHRYLVKTLIHALCCSILGFTDCGNKISMKNLKPLLLIDSSTHTHTHTAYNSKHYSLVIIVLILFRRIYYIKIKIGLLETLNYYILYTYITNMIFQVFTNYCYEMFIEYVMYQKIL